MQFVQIIEITTDRFEEFEALHEKWLAATEGTRTTKVEWTMRDRDNPNRYLVAVQFDSYEDAMKNNDLPATSEIAAGLGKLGTATFHNLDLLRVD